MKRTLSTKPSIKKKHKLETEDSIDYTKSLTSEDAETIESGFNIELDNADIPQKITEKKTKAIKKKILITDEENKLAKKTKGKSSTTNGWYILIET